ncbi:MAG TPA: spore photoproduct lyase [Thermoanaerobacterales bacterium]|jgi:spore photoproduct lyase|nr:spore photoproduct lyase [Thermoanaerobacterales bacterium]
MNVFVPKRALFEKEALDYPIGKHIFDKMQELGVDTSFIGSHNRVTGIPGKTPQEAYFEGKRTLVVGLRRTLDFQTCKPSAHYQLPLVTSCIGECEYCYLNTTLGKKPYIRVYVNIDEILARAKEYINKRKPDITIFEGSATSDPLPVEPYTGLLRESIEFFGTEKLSLFRFVTKFTNVDSLLDINHNSRTTFRFSINADSVIRRFEHRTPPLYERITAAVKVASAGFPLGFIIGPIFHYPQWEREYGQMVESLAEKLFDKLKTPPAFELITHRFTERAKRNILKVFPKTQLPLDEGERKFKYGQFGYGKYIYPKDKMTEMKTFFEEKIRENFPDSDILYFV